MKNTYVSLSLMAVLSFVSMFALMYMMVDRFDNVIPNVNQFYMAAIMTSPMLIIEIVLMWPMYKNKKANTVLIGLSVVVLVLFSLFIREQTAVSDKEFLRSMIPHHGGAVLMCKNPNLRDAEIVELCRSITTSQQSEIDWMKRKLGELDAK